MSRQKNHEKFVRHPSFKLVTSLFLIVSLFFLSCNRAFASEEIPEKEEKGKVGFTVEAVKPTTQLDPTKSFFFIKVAPQEPQKLTLKVKSTQKAEEKVKLYIKNAYTTSEGTIDYDHEDIIKDETLVQPIEELASVEPKEVTVKEFETKDVTITINPPAEAFEGVKIGAICAMSATDETEEKGIGSSFGYRVGLVAMSEEDDYENGSSLNLIRVKPTVDQGKRVIQARLQNPESQILNELEVQTALRKKGEKEVLRERKATGMRMAPNSQFDFSTTWGLDPIEQGDYVLSIKAFSGPHSWSWEEEFSINKETAQKMNEEAVYTLTYPKWAPLVVMALGILTLMNIGCLYLRRKKWEAR
ncbi:DUF916 and DUF3324 domain-containing protein [Enterococcus sp. AZ072]|uniref:DUF916 and DUF3324 domain-containing protein n=1 Tax=unclassified Enterococcus TaxID=2608891 RepID=UPI003D275DE9